MQLTKHLRRIAATIAPAFVICGASLVCGIGAQTTAHAQVSTTYRGAQNDPFAARRPVVIVRRAKGATTKSAKAVAAAPTVILAPDVKTRIDRYRAQKLAAMNAQQPAPKPVTAFLLNEVQVIGIFRTPRGYAAMVEATPIKLSYVIYPGEAFYDGQLVAVEEGRLVFRRIAQYSNGKREIVVETKPLRTADAVRDALTVTKTDADTAPVGVVVTAPVPPASGTIAAPNAGGTDLP